MNPYIHIIHFRDGDRITSTYDISEDQRQQIVSLIETPQTETTTPEEATILPLYRYEELASYDGHIAFFAIEITSSNQDPNFINSRKLFLTYRNAYKEYAKVNADVGTTRNLIVLFPQARPLLLTLDKWNEQSPTAETLITETNRGNKLHDHNIIVVVNQDNHIEDIRPPFKTEIYEDDLIDYTQCFERHLVPSHIDHGNREDIITYALSLVGIQPDGEGFEVSKVVLLNSMMHKNFPE